MIWQFVPIALLIVLLGATPLPVQPSSVCQDDAEEVPLLLGAVLPLTGHLSLEGQEILNGYVFWRDWVIQEFGGIPTATYCYQPELIVYDSQSNDALVQAGMNHLLHYVQVDIVLGGYPDSALKLMTAATERSGKLMIGGITHANSLFEQNNQQVFLFYRSIEAWLAQPISLFSRLEVDRVGILSDQADSYFVHVLVNLLDMSGITSHEIVTFPTAAIDLAPSIVRLREYQPDVVILRGYNRDMLNAIDSMQRFRLHPGALLILSGAEEPGFTSRLGQVGEYVWSAASWHPHMPLADSMLGSAEDYAEQYADQFGYLPGFLAATATNAGLVLQHAIITADSIDPGRVSDALRNLAFNTFWGTVDFDTSGISRVNEAVVVQIQRGEATIVAPENTAMADLVWPMPPW